MDNTAPIRHNRPGFARPLHTANMNFESSLKLRIAAIAKAVVIGLIAGAVFDWLNTPLPWMIGPLIAIGGGNLLGYRLDAVPFGRQAGQLMIGTAVGLYFTPKVLAALLEHLGLVAAAGVLTIIIASLGALMLSRFTGIDRTTAFFASVPGGAIEMAVLAERFGASVPAVALGQSVRVSIIVITVPWVLTLSGVAGAEPVTRLILPFDPVVLTMMLAGGIIVGVIGVKLRIQNAFVLCPLFLSAGLTASEVELSSVPQLLTNGAQLMFGLALGSHYRRDFFLRHKSFVPFTMINAVYVIVVCTGAGALLAAFAGLPVASVVLGMAPGGIAEMAITAQVLELAVALVVAFHLVRVVLVNLGTPYLVRAVFALRKRFNPPPA